MKYSQRHGQQKGMFFNIEVVKSLNYNICSCHYYHECISLGGQLSFQYFPTSYGDMLIWGDQELFYCSNEGCTVFFRSLLCGFMFPNCNTRHWLHMLFSPSIYLPVHLLITSLLYNDFVFVLGDVMQSIESISRQDGAIHQHSFAAEEHFTNAITGTYNYNMN